MLGIDQATDLDSALSEDLELAQLALTITRIDRYINIANIKASLVVPATGVFLVFLGESRAAYLNLLKGTAIEWMAPFSYALTVACLMLASFLALRALVPFLASGHRPGEYLSLIFFGSIADMRLETYLKRIKASTRETLADDLARQAHLLSRALTVKFKAVNKSFLFLFLGISISASVLALDSLLKLFL